MGLQDRDYMKERQKAYTPQKSFVATSKSQQWGGYSTGEIIRMVFFSLLFLLVAFLVMNHFLDQPRLQSFQKGVGFSTLPLIYFYSKKTFRR